MSLTHAPGAETISAAVTAALEPPETDVPTRALRALIADDDNLARRITSRQLQSRGIATLLASDGLTAASIAREQLPDVVLLDVHMPFGGMEGLELLRGDHRTGLIPVIVVTGDGRPEMLVQLLLAGADDYVTKPYTLDELEARIIVATRRRTILGSVNPLTGMAGNVVLTAEINRRLAAGSRFALVYVDLDEFKAYNDRYGYIRGDAAIGALANCMRLAADGLSPADDPVLLAHIGGDDFAALVPPELARTWTETLIDHFEALRSDLHDPADLRAGGYLTHDRRGRAAFAHLLSVSVGIVSSDGGPFASAAAMADVAAEVKHLAKRARGSSVSVNRRRETRRL